jgi:3-hydroxyacyl-CoA dehydrogenase/enoyl-CoA hydratase/carnithine racemase
MDQAPAIALSRPEPDLVVLTFHSPDRSANILSRAVLGELERHLDQLATASAPPAGLILMSAKPGVFIAGADLREFADSFDAPAEEVEALCRRGQDLFRRLSQFPFVTVAAIEGICVGGGAELAMWCDRRLLSDHEKTQFGFPEVKLGLFPGWGGTARTPRVIGLGNAVELITGGEPLSAQEACRLGLAWGPIPSHELFDAAVRVVREEQQTRQFECDRAAWSQPIAISETELAFLGATASAYIRGQTKDQYPAPLAALEVMLEAAGKDVEAACRLEATGMTSLFGTPVNRSLINVFFLTDRNKKDMGVDGKPVKPGSIERVGVVGAGIMGSGIVAANLKRQFPVVLGDASAAAIQQGARNSLEEAAYDKVRKGPDPERVLELAPRLRSADGDAAFAGCQLVVEAVVENQQVKQQVLKRLETHLAEDAILASNTSTIPITKLAAELQRPDRFCGLHFFNPVRRMKLVEVIRGDKTSDTTVATAVAYAKKLGKFPIVVRDGPGFLVNRLLFPFMNEALELVCEGVDIPAIERAAKSFGMPMGPLELYDMVGLDTAFYAGRVMWEAFPQRIGASPLLPALVKAGRLGQKSGRGFYIHAGRKRGKLQLDPELAPLIAPYLRGKSELDRTAIQRRLMLPMVLEATRVLSEGLVRDVRDVDLGMIFGLGFPPFRGGLLWWADQVGAAELLEWLKPFESLGERAQPTTLLLEMAAKGRRFYDKPS